MTVNIILGSDRIDPRIGELLSERNLRHWYWYAQQVPLSDLLFQIRSHIDTMHQYSEHLDCPIKCTRKHVWEHAIFGVNEYYFDNAIAKVVGACYVELFLLDPELYLRPNNILEAVEKYDIRNIKVSLCKLSMENVINHEVGYALEVHPDDTFGDMNARYRLKLDFVDPD